jgi:hypothetical protein
LVSISSLRVFTSIHLQSLEWNRLNVVVWW